MCKHQIYLLLTILEIEPDDYKKVMMPSQERLPSQSMKVLHAVMIKYNNRQGTFNIEELLHRHQSTVVIKQPSVK